jgi:hypothetical protein
VEDLGFADGRMARAAPARNKRKIKVYMSVDHGDGTRWSHFFP